MASGKLTTHCTNEVVGLWAFQLLDEGLNHIQIPIIIVNVASTHVVIFHSANFPGQITKIYNEMSRITDEIAGLHVQHKMTQPLTSCVKDPGEVTDSTAPSNVSK